MRAVLVHAGELTPKACEALRARCRANHVAQQHAHTMASLPAAAASLPCRGCAVGRRARAPPRSAAL